MTDRRTLGKGPALGRLCLFLACSAGCPTVSPVIAPASDDGQVTSDTRPSNVLDSSTTIGPVDEFGRLLTGPGLCGIWGGEVDQDGIGARLALTYDDQGQPKTATTEFVPNCTREEPDPSEKILGLVPDCYEDIETQSMEWTWDAAGNLIAIEHTVNVDFGSDFWGEDPDDPRREADNGYGVRQCLVDDAVLVIERNQWRYDTEGRVIGWTQTYADCQGTETIEETLEYGHGFIDVTHVTPRSTSETRFELDGDGRVAAAGAVRHRYDELGRLVATTLADGTSRTWSYEAPLVTEHGQAWTQVVSANKRTITLDSGTEDERVVIVLDAAGRPETITVGDEHWGLEYDGCPNANRASARWLVHALFEAWPFPDEPQPGRALEQRDAWSRRDLPLRPF